MSLHWACQVQKLLAQILLLTAGVTQTKQKISWISSGEKLIAAASNFYQFSISY